MNVRIRIVGVVDFTDRLAPPIPNEPQIDLIASPAMKTEKVAYLIHKI